MEDSFYSFDERARLRFNYLATIDSYEKKIDKDRPLDSVLNYQALNEPRKPSEPAKSQAFYNQKSHEKANFNMYLTGILAAFFSFTILVNLLFFGFPDIGSLFGKILSLGVFIWGLVAIYRNLGKEGIFVGPSQQKFRNQTSFILGIASIVAAFVFMRGITSVIGNMFYLAESDIARNQIIAALVFQAISLFVGIKFYRKEAAGLREKNKIIDRENADISEKNKEVEIFNNSYDQRLKAYEKDLANYKMALVAYNHRKAEIAKKVDSNNQLIRADRNSNKEAMRKYYNDLYKKEYTSLTKKLEFLKGEIERELRGDWLPASYLSFDILARIYELLDRRAATTMNEASRLIVEDERHAEIVANQRRLYDSFNQAANLHLQKMDALLQRADTLIEGQRTTHTLLEESINNQKIIQAQLAFMEENQREMIGLQKVNNMLNFFQLLELTSISSDIQETNAELSRMNSQVAGMRADNASYHNSVRSHYGIW